MATFTERRGISGFGEFVKTYKSVEKRLRKFVVYGMNPVGIATLQNLSFDVIFFRSFWSRLCSPLQEQDGDELR